jgi:asparagine synthase (glutamine-hydrolysing)
MSDSTRGDFLLILGKVLVPGDFLRALGRYPYPASSAVWRFLRIGPDLTLACRGDIEILEGDYGGAGIYHLAPASSGRIVPADEFQAAAAEGWRRGSLPSPAQIAGRFCFVLWDVRGRRILGCTDPFKTLPLYTASVAGCVACATDLRLLLAAEFLTPAPDEHALYHYLNFGYVPSPFCAIRNVEKIPPGSTWVGAQGESATAAYWEPEYPEDLQGDLEGMARGLRRKITEDIVRYQPRGPGSWGTFLSGGTDSTAIAAILSTRTPRPDFTTFSIGFEESSYSELRYVRIAASRFGLKSRERIMRSAEALAIIPRLLEGFDEPFGNSGAIPAYLCAAEARAAGIETLLAGDGGDEIFGGNDWYRKNRILGWYAAAPALLKRLTSGVLDRFDQVDSYPLHRARNFVRRGSLANPERVYAGDSFASQCFAQLLTPDFRARVGEQESLEVVRETFSRPRTRSELHRLMYLDLKRTLADSDVVKVGRTSRMADVSVAFPYLDHALVDYTGRLPADTKVRGLRKRFLFKRALHDLLPPAIRRKKKQGFGVPMSVWLRRERPFQDLFEDGLFSRKARERGYFETDYIRRLWEIHRRGNWDHSVALYRLLMLELWTRSHLDAG